jgi:hypothetical protein
MASIPGYYFDAEKQRYFKISKNHHAHTEKEAKYSQFGVSRLPQTPSSGSSKRQTVDSRQPKQHVPMATVSSSSRLPIQEFLNRMELLPRDRILKAYLNLFRDGDYRKQKTPPSIMRECLNFVNENIWRVFAFDWDPELRALWTCTSSYYGLEVYDGRVSLIASGKRDLFSVRNDYSSNEAFDVFYRTKGSPLRMSVLPGIGVVTFESNTSGGLAHRSTEALLHLIRYNEVEGKKSSIFPVPFKSFYTVYKHEPGDEHCCISINPCPNGPKSVLVSQGPYFSTVNLVSGELCRNSSLRSDILSMEWLQPTTAAIGLRNSAVLLVDFRVASSVVRLKHGGAVTNLAKADDSGNSIVVTGVPNSLSLYDLRMTKTAPECMQRRRKHEYHSEWANQLVSQSVWQAEYRNAEDIELGFSLKRDIMAAAQDDGSLNVYSSKTGAVLRTLRAEKETAPYLQKQQSTFKEIKIIEDDLSAIQILGVYDGRLLNFGVD